MSEQTTNPQSNPAGAPSGTQTSSNFDQFLQEAGEFIHDFALAAGKAAEDLTGLMVLPVNKDLRGKLDELVETGAVKTRGEAALRLLRDGITSNQSIYQEVEKARSRIEALRGQLREVLGQNS